MTTTVTSDSLTILTWVQAVASLAALGVAVVLAMITYLYMKETRRMANEMEAEREDRRRTLSVEAAGRLVRAFLNARQVAEEGKWSYAQLYWPLQPVLHENRDLLDDPALRERIDIVNAMLEQIYEMQAEGGRNSFGELLGKVPETAKPRAIEGFKAVADDLTLFRRGQAISPSRLPKADRVREWMREAPHGADVFDYQ